jgi:quercetin dioxygenase-like cupin family protein
MTETVSIQRWPRDEEPTDAALQRLLEREGLPYYSWSNGPGDVYATHAHSYHKVLYVARGSITFGLPEIGQQITLQVGDRLDLPAGTKHNALVGPHGVTCLEGQRPR